MNSKEDLQWLIERFGITREDAEKAPIGIRQQLHDGPIVPTDAERAHAEILSLRTALAAATERAERAERQIAAEFEKRRRKTDVYLNMIAEICPNVRSYDPMRSTVPYQPNDNSFETKMAYAKFILETANRASNEWWMRQLRFVEGLLWGAGVMTIRRMMEIDKEIYG